jgi:hypothetical protein
MDEKQINREIFSCVDPSRRNETPVSQEAIDECQIMSILTKLSALTLGGAISLVPTSPANAYKLFAHGTLFLDKAVELSASDEMMSRHMEVYLTIKAKLAAAEGAQDTTKTTDALERLKKRAQRKLTTEDGTEQEVDISAVYFNAPYDNELVPAVGAEDPTQKSRCVRVGARHTRSLRSEYDGSAAVQCGKRRQLGNDPTAAAETWF